MNETHHQDSAADAPWPTPEHQARVPDTSMLPGSEKAPPAALGLLNNAVKGAHNTIDCFSDSAAPAVRHLAESASAARQSLHVQSDHLRVARDEWVEGARSTVRCHPLASVAAALAFGALIARLVR